VSFRVVDHTVGERYTYTWYERAKQRLFPSGIHPKTKYLGCTPSATSCLIRLSFPSFGVSAQSFAENACGWLPFAHATMTAARTNNRYDAADLDLLSPQTTKPTRRTITADLSDQYCRDNDAGAMDRRSCKAAEPTRRLNCKSSACSCCPRCQRDSARDSTKFC
jgi:hypothetical protein